ncbi:MAG: M48 family metallopeptidase, partial [Alphaproteobacteria bacterium]|nr:M48 family metallopeptidase [Alphaproteobacteria bacterium]
DSWMLEKLRALPRPIAFKDGAVLPILGRNRTLEITYDKDLTSTSIALKHNKLVVFTNKRNPDLRIRRFLRDLAAQELGKIVNEKAARIDREVIKLEIRDTKSRWGSCSEDSRMTLCWRLIFAPFEAYDYVIGHEVAHLVHMDHSKEFWALCRALSEDFIEGQYWMRNHGHELMRYGA